MKMDGGVFEARSVHELDQQVIAFSAEGWRIISVLDRSTAHDDRFLIVAQREPELVITVADNGPGLFDGR